jgi:hypothetical protein
MNRWRVYVTCGVLRNRIRVDGVESSRDAIVYVRTKYPHCIVGRVEKVVWEH